MAFTLTYNRSIYIDKASIRSFLHAVDNNSYTVRNLKKHTGYKLKVRAYVKRNGKKKYVSNSLTAHAYTGNARGNCTNAKEITVNKASLSLRKGNGAKLKVTVTGVIAGKELVKHCATVRYFSTDEAVATVSASGASRLAWSSTSRDPRSRCA